MSLVRLVFKQVAEIVATKEVGLVVLTTEDGSRQLSIIADKNMVFQLGLRQSKVEIREKLLPEVLWQVIARNLDMRYQIVINDLVDGQYKTLLYMPDILQAIPIRASDAVLLSLISDTPIFIEDNLLRRQGVPYKEGESGVPVPVNILSSEMLRNALDKALEKEDYEKASELRDELKRRGDKGVAP